MSTPNEVAQETRQIASRLIGMTAPLATRTAEMSGRKIRVISEDGVPYVGTSDWRPERINLTLIDGKVVEVSVG